MEVRLYFSTDSFSNGGACNGKHKIAVLKPCRKSCRIIVYQYRTSTGNRYRTVRYPHFLNSQGREGHTVRTYVRKIG